MPNDPLKTQTRHEEALYWSFLDFRPTALANEDCWLVAATLRKHVARGLEDELVQWVWVVAKSFFGSIRGNFRNGVTIKLFGEDVGRVVFADLYMILGDERAPVSYTHLTLPTKRIV